MKNPATFLVDSIRAGWNLFRSRRTQEELGAELATTAQARDLTYALVLRTLLLRRVAHSPVESAIGLGWRTKTAEDQDATSEIDKALKLVTRVRDARIAARTSGGALLWVRNEDEDQSTPIGPGPHRVRVVHLVTRYEALPETWTDDDASENFGRPEVYSIQMVRDGVSMRGARRVHWTRLVYVPGLLAQPDEQTGGLGWDLSVGEVYADPIAAYTKGMQAVSKLLGRLGMPHFQMADIDSLSADEGGLQDRLASTATAMEHPGVLMSFGEDKITWTAPSVSGVDRLVQLLREDVCSVEGMSMVELFGQPPGGLSTDDKGSERVQHRMRAAEREFVLEPILDRLYELILGPGDRSYEWIDAVIPDPEQKAKVSLLLAQRDAVAIQSTTVSASEARERYRANEEVPELTLLEEFDEPPAPSDEALQQALAEQARAVAPEEPPADAG